MPTKFYFHEAVTSVGGTLPGASQTINNNSPDQYGDSSTNRTMDATIGVAQTSKTVNTLATTALQASEIVRFVSGTLDAQTIAVQSVTIRWAALEGNAASDFLPGVALALWRPGTGAVVTLLLAAQTSPATEPGTTQTVATSTRNTLASASALSGDVLILELWRPSIAQSMGTAYANTVFYDGTTEGSTTTNAAHIQFTNNVTLSTPSASVDGFVHRRGPNYRR